MEIFDYAQDRDSAAKFLLWRERHPDGLVINCRGNALTLHVAHCGHFTFKVTDDVNLTLSKKVCSLDRQELETWAHGQSTKALRRCRSCNPG